MPFDPTLTLETARLVLTPIRATDAQALFAIQADRAVMRYWNHPAWTDLKQAYVQILDDLAALDLQRDVFEHLQRAVALLGMADIDEGFLVCHVVSFALSGRPGPGARRAAGPLPSRD